MTDHKFTDDEIIKALELCSSGKCQGCPFNSISAECLKGLTTNTLALINRQKNALEREIYNGLKADEKIESLKIANEKMYSANKEQEAEIEALKEEVNRLSFWNHIKRTAVIDEFAERLKANMSNIARMEYGGHIYFCVGYDLIDTLVKEMTEESK